jgi:hypothetical protein
MDSHSLRFLCCGSSCGLTSYLRSAEPIFFWAGLLSARSPLLAVGVARRIGLVRRVVFTHIPANGFLVLAAFMPNAPFAVACLLAPAALSQMDVPARS